VGEPVLSSSSLATERASSSSLARSLARSRVASSRFRSQLQTLQPNRAMAANQQQQQAVASLASPVGGPTLQSQMVANETLSAGSAPAGQAVRGRVAIGRSRLARPQLQRTSSAGASEAADANSASAVAGPQPSPAAAAPAASPTRSSKPRFVVVTRTGQFGIRASAISSLAAAAAASSATGDQTTTATSLEPSSVAAPVRVSSRFSKPNRFRGASQSVQVTRVRADQVAAAPSTLAPSLAAASSSPSSPGADQSPPTSSQPATTTTSAPETVAGGSTGAATTVPATSSAPSASSSPPETGAEQAQEKPEKAESRPAGEPLGAPVVVTYFTTVTHTIPFELNSETVFTTIEETNSRVATEFMSDLSSHLAVEPSQLMAPTPTSLQPIQSTAFQLLTPLSGSSGSSASSGASATSSGSSGSSERPPATTTSAATTTTTTSGSSAADTQPPSSPGSAESSTGEPERQQPAQETTTGAPLGTSGRPQVEEQKEPSGNKVEPSQVVLNTKTYFTTFTYFTTYSAGENSLSIKSSESTTSHVVTETLSETVQPTGTLSATVAATSAPEQPSSGASSGASGASEQGPPPASGAGQSAVEERGPQPDASAAAGSPQPALNLNSDLLQSSSQAPPTQQQQATSPIESSTTPVQPSYVDKITRTKSLYTTLTHFITFYSGTKTQLSTIQEISPTVVTEYIDRTLFEQLQHSSPSDSSPRELLVPTQQATLEGQLVQPTMTLTPLAAATSLPAGEQATSSPPTTSDATTSEAPTTSAPTTTSSGAPAQQETGGSSPAEPQPSGSATAAGSAPTTSSTGDRTSDQTSEQTSEQTSAATQSAASQPEGEEAGASGRVLASSGESENRQQTPNIIELSDLIASNSSQSGRVALADNLGAAIKDIVQLLAGNRTAAGLPSVALPATTTTTTTGAPTTTTGAQPSSSSQLDTSSGQLGESPAGSGPTTSSTGSASNPSGSAASQAGSASSQAGSSSPSSTGGSASSGTTVAGTSAVSTSQQGPTTKRPARLFGQTANRQQSNLVGSISSPSLAPTSTAGSSARNPEESTGAGRLQATPELSSASRSSQGQSAAPAATIFFGDDAGDERKKTVKTVWPGQQSSVLLTSVEPSTRTLVVTTTKVYYTRDSPFTLTSSFTSLIGPRTFVSTIAGTRTMVNQLNTASLAPPLSSSDSERPRGAQQQQASRQDSQASSHRLSIQGKQQRQQAHEEQQQRKKQQASAAAAAAAAAKKQQQLVSESKQVPANMPQANINQCQPACRQSANEICKFTPNSETSGAQGTFSCACKPGYHMQLNAAGQKQCQEVQSFVILLRLLQVADQQMAFKRELQSRSSPEYKQLSKLVREHVKRAYMTSELTRDRFVAAEVSSFARSLAGSSSSSLALGEPQTPQTSLTRASGTGSGRQTNGTAVQQPQEPLGSAGLIVNMTVHLQPMAQNSAQQELVQLDEATLKEELTKRLSMRQAAALAAAAAAASASGPASGGALEAAGSSSSAVAQQDQAGGQTARETQSAGQQNGSQSTMDELLPNPNALFLADVEQVTDLNECASPALNDCHEAAICINEPGSYRCDCREWPDLNPLNPGRQCGAELKSCDYCNNRGDCLRVPSLLGSPLGATNSSSAAATTTTSSNSSSSSASVAASTFSLPNGRQFSTVCQCHRIYLGRRCEINGLLLATLLPIFAILLIISVCLIIYCCRRWRKRCAMNKGFRNMGMLGGTLDRKAMLESSSESSDTQQRGSHHHLHHAHHLLHHPHHPGRAVAGGASLYDATSAAAAAIAAHLPASDMSLSAGAAGSSSNESSPRQMVRSDHHHHHQATTAAGGLLAAGPLSQSGSSSTGGLNSIAQQIVIPRARHNQVNYAVHRGQVYMW